MVEGKVIDCSDCLEGVKTFYPKIVYDERGTVRRFISKDDPDFSNFGDVYTTTVYSGVIKGWHAYYTKTLYYVVPHGMIKLVLYDGRKESPTYQDFQEVFISQENYIRLTIPPMIYTAFRGLYSPYSLAVICATEPYSEEGTIRVPIEEFPYDWTIKNR